MDLSFPFVAERDYMSIPECRDVPPPEIQRRYLRTVAVALFGCDSLHQIPGTRHIISFLLGRKYVDILSRE